MRRIIVAAMFAIAVAGAAPAYAQFGGSPDLQIDGDYEQIDGDYEPTGDDYDPAYGKPEYGDGGFDGAYGGKDEWAGVDGYADPDYPDQDYPQESYQDYSQEAHEGETWQGDDGRAYCRRSDGATGLIVGAGAGALVGRGIDTRGERGTGTILGAIAGALLGAAVDRGATCQ